jgi:hypothetical protein
MEEMQWPKRRAGSTVKWTPTPDEFSFGEGRLLSEGNEEIVTPRTDSLVYKYEPLSDEAALESYRENDFVGPFPPLLDDDVNEVVDAQAEGRNIQEEQGLGKAGGRREKEEILQEMKEEKDKDDGVIFGTQQSQMVIALLSAFKERPTI